MTPRRKYEHSYHSHGYIHASIVPYCRVKRDNRTGTKIQTFEETQGSGYSLLVWSRPGHIQI